MPLALERARPPRARAASPALPPTSAPQRSAPALPGVTATAAHSDAAGSRGRGVRCSPLLAAAAVTSSLSTLPLPHAQHAAAASRPASKAGSVTPGGAEGLAESLTTSAESWSRLRSAPAPAEQAHAADWALRRQIAIARAEHRREVRRQRGGPATRFAPSSSSPTALRPDAFLRKNDGWSVQRELQRLQRRRGRREHAEHTWCCLCTFQNTGDQQTCVVCMAERSYVEAVRAERDREAQAAVAAATTAATDGKSATNVAGVGRAEPAPARAPATEARAEAGAEATAPTVTTVAQDAALDALAADDTAHEGRVKAVASAGARHRPAAPSRASRCAHWRPQQARSESISGSGTGPARDLREAHPARHDRTHWMPRQCSATRVASLLTH